MFEKKLLVVIKTVSKIQILCWVCESQNTTAGKSLKGFNSIIDHQHHGSSKFKNQFNKMEMVKGP